MIASLALLCFLIPQPSHAQAGVGEDDRQMDARISNASGEARECVKDEKKRYEDAVNWFPKIRNKDSFAKYSCQPMHSAQEYPPKPCCDAYYVNRSKPGMGDEAWYVLQECGWREEIRKRKETYHKKAETCLQKYPVAKQPSQSAGGPLSERIRRSIEGYPTLQQAMREMIGKNAFIVGIDGAGNFSVINNRGQRLAIPASLAGKFGMSKQFAILFNNDFLTKALPGRLVASSEHGSIRGTINGGGDFVYMEQELKDYLYLMFNNNRIDMNMLAVSLMIASSEHGSVRGTINGTGDFLDKPLPPSGSISMGPDKGILLAYDDHRNELIARDFVKGPAMYASSQTPNHVFIITPSAQMTIVGKAVVDVGHNGVTGVLVLEGKARIREGNSAAEREIPAGSAAIIVPGYGIGNTVSAREIRINPWWESTAGTRQSQPSGWTSILAKGNPVTVILDAVTDSNESSRYLGTIKAGERYTIQYIPSSGQWKATGYNKGTKTSGTSTYAGGKPENREFNIWGHIFQFDETGRVFDSRLGYVGRLLSPR